MKAGRHPEVRKYGEQAKTPKSIVSAEWNTGMKAGGFRWHEEA